MKKHLIRYFFYYIHKKMNRQKANEIKNNVFIIKWDKKRRG